MTSLLMKKLSENLDEEVVGVAQENVQKILDWLDDNQMLSFKGRQFAQCHYNMKKK